MCLTLFACGTLRGLHLAWRLFYPALRLERLWDRSCTSGLRRLGVFCSALSLGERLTGGGGYGLHRLELGSQHLQRLFFDSGFRAGWLRVPTRVRRGAFSEYDTVLLSDWLAKTPRSVLSKNFAVPKQALSRMPDHVSGDFCLACARKAFLA